MVRDHVYDHYIDSTDWSHDRDMAGDNEWLVEDSEDEGALLPSGPGDLLGQASGMCASQRPALRLTAHAASTIQTATFSARPLTPERARQSPDISNGSLFTPPGESHSVNPADRSPGQTADAPAKPKPRPRPRIKSKKPSDNPDEFIQTNTSDTPRASHMSDSSTVLAKTATHDTIQTATTTFLDFSSIVADAYSSLDIAERAKMRSRKSQAKKPVYIPDDVIELTSDDDELALKPSKRQKQHGNPTKPKPRPRPKVKSKAIELPSPDSQCDGLTSTGPPKAQKTTGPSSQAPVSTAPTNPPTTPPQPQETPPSPSPVANTRKRKRNDLVATDEEEEMEIDKGPSEETSLPANEPPPFFPSPSPPMHIPDSGIEMPESTKVVREERSGGISKKKPTQRKSQTKVKKKGKGKKDEQTIEPTETPQDRPAATTPSDQVEVDNRLAASSRGSSSKEPVKPSVKRKGKAKAIVPPSDEENEATPSRASPLQNRSSGTTLANASPGPAQCATPASTVSDPL